MAKNAKKSGSKVDKKVSIIASSIMTEFELVVSRRRAVEPEKALQFSKLYISLIESRGQLETERSGLGS